MDRVREIICTACYFHDIKVLCVHIDMMRLQNVQEYSSHVHIIGMQVNRSFVRKLSRQQHLKMLELKIFLKTFETKLFSRVVIALITEEFIDSYMFLCITTFGDVIPKWEEHQSIINRPRKGAHRKISGRTVRKIVRRVVQQ